LVSAQAATTPFYIISDTTTGGKAIASQRILWKGKYFEEVPGTESDQLSSHYLWTWYDEFSPGFSQDEVIVVNPTSDPVRVDISFKDVSSGSPADTVNGSAVLQPAGSPGGTDSWSFRYEGRMGGPVEVKAYRGAPGSSWNNQGDRRISSRPNGLSRTRACLQST